MFRLLTLAACLQVSSAFMAAPAMPSKLAQSPIAMGIGSDETTRDPEGGAADIVADWQPAMLSKICYHLVSKTTPLILASTPSPWPVRPVPLRRMRARSSNVPGALACSKGGSATRGSITASAARSPTCRTSLHSGVSDGGIDLTLISARAPRARRSRVCHARRYPAYDARGLR